MSLLLPVRPLPTYPPVVTIRPSTNPCGGKGAHPMMSCGDTGLIFTSSLSWRGAALAAWTAAFTLATVDTIIDGKIGLLSLWAILMAALAVTLTAQWRATVQRRERQRALALVTQPAGDPPVRIR